MNYITRMSLTVATACALAIGVAGCNRHETPAETQADVQKAESEGMKDVAEARADTNNDRIDAQKKVNDATTELGHENAKADKAVTIAEANAAYKVNIEKCEAMTGDERDACKKQASAELESAKAFAKTEAHAMDPKQ